MPDPVESGRRALGGTRRGNATNAGADVSGRLRRGVPAAGVIGRETETATMSDAFKRVVAGEGREVLLCLGRGRSRQDDVGRRGRLALPSMPGACVLFGALRRRSGGRPTSSSSRCDRPVRSCTLQKSSSSAHVDAHGSEAGPFGPLRVASRIPDLPPSKATDTDTEQALGVRGGGGACWSSCLDGNRSWSLLDDLAVGGQGEPANCCVTSLRPSKRCGSSCSRPIATASCRARIRSWRRWRRCAARSVWVASR